MAVGTKTRQLIFVLSGDGKGARTAFTEVDAALKQTGNQAEQTSRRATQSFGQMESGSRRLANSHATDARRIETGNRSVEASFVHLEHVGTRSLTGLHHAAKTAIGVTGLGGLAFGLKDITQEAIKAQAEQAKLGQAVKNAGISWDAHEKSVEANLVATSQWSGFAKSELSASLANMVRTTGSLSGAFKANAIAMDLARTKGMDLQGAQSLVARAYLGNTRGLKSLGIAITPVTTQQDKLKTSLQDYAAKIRDSHGDVKVTLEQDKVRLQNLKDQAKAQDAAATSTKAVGLLQQKFSGQAATFATTDAGRFEQARQSLTNAEEQIGTQLLPAFASVAKETAKIAQSFTKAWPEIKQDIGDTVGPIFKVAEGVGKFVGHNAALRAAAIDFVAIAGAAKVIGKVAEISGVGSAAGFLRGRAGGAAGSGLLTAAEIGGGAAITSRLLGSSAVSTAESRLTLAASQRGAGWENFRYGAPVSALGPAERPGMFSRAAGGVSGFVSRAAVPVVAGVLTDSYARGYANSRDLKSGLPTSGSGFQSTVRDLESWSLKQPKWETNTRKFGDAVKNLGDLSGVSVKQLEKLQAQADSLTGRWAPATKALSKFSDAAHEELVSRVGGAFDAMSEVAGSNLHTIRVRLGDATGTIKHTLGDNTAAGRDALARNFRLAAQDIQVSMDAGVISTKTGTAEINKLFGKALSAYGIGGKSLGIVSIAAGDVAAAYTAAGGKASGGWIGSPGERGGDNVPTMLGRGEAVLNRHQQQYVNAALGQTYGTNLAGLFSQVKRPHYMAAGGFVQGGGTNYSVGDEPEIARRLNKLGRYLHRSLTGISGYRTPQHSVEVGGFANDPHTRGQASDTPGVESVSEAVLERFGLTRPFPGAAEADHIQLLKGGHGYTGAPVSGSKSFAVVKPLHHVKFAGGLGVISKIGQAGLDRVRAAANHALRHIVGGVSPSGGPSGGGAQANMRLGRSMMLAAGWPADQWPALKALWTQESGWDSHSVNSTSGAYGIPQSLGHGHPFALGDARGQIAWGLNYIKGRYGSPDAAEAHERAYNWYASGGFVDGIDPSGGDGASIADYPSSGASFSMRSIDSSISNITSSAPAANGPKPKAGPKPTTRINPDTGQIETHSKMEWLHIQQAHTAYLKAHPKKTRDINPLNGKTETHTAGEWHSIRLRYKQIQAEKKRQAQRGTAYDIQSSFATSTAGHGLLTGNINEQIGAAQIQKGADLGRLAKINKALKNPHLKGATVIRLQNERGQLLTDIKAQDDAIKQIPINAKDAADQVLSDDFGKVQDALGDVDLHVQAGDITQAEGDAQKQGIYNSARTGGFGALSSHDQLQLKADQNAPLIAAQKALAEQLKELTDQVKRQTDFANAVVATENFTLVKGLADVLSGHIVGSGVAGRALTAGAGSAATY